MPGTMDKREARDMLRTQLAPWRQKTYSELSNHVGQSQRFELVGPSGTWYQGTVQVFWDAEPQGSIRVIAAIDDGGRRSFIPMTDDFIVSSDGTFIDE
jgi:hypothetical protein